MNRAHLGALIKAVEAGTIDERIVSLAPFCATDFETGSMAMQAYLGSLDAAMALHKALLPGWDLAMGTYDDDVFEASVSERLSVTTFDGHNSNLARALLLAILRALEAVEAA